MQQPADGKPSGSTFQALRYRNFRLLWIGLLVSNAGSWMHTVAQGYLVYEMTGDPLVLGTNMLMRAIPILVLSFIGGTIADRIDKRRLLITSQSIFALLILTLAVVTTLGLVQVWHIYLLTFLGGILSSFEQPTRQAMIPSLVPKEDLMNAIALNSITFTGASTFGSALGALLIPYIGIAGAFYVNAISFGAVIYAAYQMELPPHGRQEKRESVRSALLSGVSYVWANPVLLGLVSLAAFYSFFANPYHALLPVMAKDVLFTDVEGLGYMTAAPGLGVLVGGFLLARFAWFPNKGLLLMAGLGGYTLLLFAFSVSRSLLLSLGILLLIGTFSTIYQSTVQTMLQRTASDAFRGRVMSLFTISVLGMWPLGSFPISALARLWSAPVGIAVGASVAGCFALWLFTTQSHMRRASL